MTERRFFYGAMVIRKFFKDEALLRAVPFSDRKKARALLALYRRVDRHIARFRRLSGLSCAPQCGECCQYPNVEATSLEMMPLAYSLLSDKKAEHWVDLAFSDSKDKTCIFFKPEIRAAEKGRCSVYHFRPLVCRLFGFAADTDKHNKPFLVACRIIRDRFVQEVKTANGAKKVRDAMPKMSRYSDKVAEIDPGLGSRQLPINEAVRSALSRAGMIVHYAKERAGSL